MSNFSIFALIFVLSSTEPLERSTPDEMIFPEKEEKSVRFFCHQDIIDIGYTLQPTKPVSFLYFRISGKRISKDKIESLNRMFLKSKIDDISVVSCPLSKRDQKPIKIHFQLSNYLDISNKSARTISITRNGEFLKL